MHLMLFSPPKHSFYTKIVAWDYLQTQENNDVLAYWLSNASTLLLLLQRTLKASGAAGMTPQRRRSSATLFGRMTQVCHHERTSYFYGVSFIDKANPNNFSYCE